MAGIERLSQVIQSRTAAECHRDHVRFGFNCLEVVQGPDVDVDVARGVLWKADYCGVERHLAEGVSLNSDLVTNFHPDLFVRYLFNRLPSVMEYRVDCHVLDKDLVAKWHAGGIALKLHVVILGLPFLHVDCGKADIVVSIMEVEVNDVKQLYFSVFVHMPHHVRVNLNRLAERKAFLLVKLYPVKLDRTHCLVQHLSD